MPSLMFQSADHAGHRLVCGIEDECDFKTQNEQRNHESGNLDPLDQVYPSIRRLFEKCDGGIEIPKQIGERDRFDFSCDRKGLHRPGTRNEETADKRNKVSRLPVQRNAIGIEVVGLNFRMPRKRTGKNPVMARFETFEAFSQEHFVTCPSRFHEPVRHVADSLRQHALAPAYIDHLLIQSTLTNGPDMQAVRAKDEHRDQQQADHVSSQKLGRVHSILPRQ